MFAVLLIVAALCFVPGIPNSFGNAHYTVIAVVSVYLLIAVLVGVMETRVLNDRVVVGFGLIRLIRFSFRLDDISRVEAKTYSPMWEYGGWGIRGFGSKRALNMRGNRGVELILNEPGRRPRSMMIGSQHAEDLEMAINQAIADRHYQNKGM